MDGMTTAGRCIVVAPRGIVGEAKCRTRSLTTDIIAQVITNFEKRGDATLLILACKKATKPKDSREFPMRVMQAQYSRAAHEVKLTALGKMSGQNERMVVVVALDDMYASTDGGTVGDGGGGTISDQSSSDHAASRTVTRAPALRERRGRTSGGVRGGGQVRGAPTQRKRPRNE